MVQPGTQKIEKKSTKGPKKASPTIGKSKMEIMPESRTSLIAESAVSLAMLSLAISVIQTVLRPLFGSVPTQLYFGPSFFAAAMFSAIYPSVLWAFDTSMAMTTLLCLVPPIVHWLGSKFASLYKDPNTASLTSSCLVMIAVIPIMTNSIRKLLVGRSVLIKSAIGAVVAALVIRLQNIWSLLPYTRVFSQPLLLVIMACSLNILRLLRIFKTSRRHHFLLSLTVSVLVTLPALFYPPIRFQQPPFTHESGSLRVLSSTPSTTGQIIVAEDFERGFRYLRADHSLLGGVWLGPKHLVRQDGDTKFLQDKSGTYLGDSIYSTFVLQEAARLQIRERPHESALIIGLGVGISASAFMQLGLSTSIVEIDRAVYDAARDYFGLPEPAAAYIEDGRGWMVRQASMRNGTYDIIIHDCFSGGGVPSHLFTMEFWASAKQVLDPEGIVAVNFAGVIGDSSSKAVLLTLEASFGNCRIFHDYKSDASQDVLLTEFINLVFFCSPSSKPLQFHPSSKDDYLHSYLREYVLMDLPKREIERGLVLGDLQKDEPRNWILTDARNPLGPWQDAATVDHWKVMRSVLPDYVWATY